MRRTEVKRHKTRDMADGKRREAGEVMRREAGEVMRREAGEVMRREAGEVWMLLPSFMGNRVFTNPGRSVFSRVVFLRSSYSYTITPSQAGSAKREQLIFLRLALPRHPK